MAKIGEYLNLCTPKGRIVTGPLYKLNQTEWRNGAQVAVTRDKWKYKFGLALPKSNPATITLMGKIYNHALATFSSNEIAVRNGVVAAIQRGLQKRSGFSWKVYDGDVINELTGKKPKHCEGCFVIPFELPEFINGQPAQFRTFDWRNQPIDWTEVKLGYECDVAFSIIDNGILTSVQGGVSAGVYFNATFVRYLGTGEEIVFGPSIDEAMPAAEAPSMSGFGAAPVAAQTSATPPATGFGGTDAASTSATPVSPANAGFPVAATTVQGQTVQVDVGAPGFPNGASASAIASPTEPSGVPGFVQPA